MIHSEIKIQTPWIQTDNNINLKGQLRIKGNGSLRIQVLTRNWLSQFLDIIARIFTFNTCRYFDGYRIFSSKDSIKRLFFGINADVTHEKIKRMMFTYQSIDPTSRENRLKAASNDGTIKTLKDWETNVLTNLITTKFNELIQKINEFKNLSESDKEHKSLIAFIDFHHGLVNSVFATMLKEESQNDVIKIVMNAWKTMEEADCCDPYNQIRFLETARPHGLEDILTAQAQNEEK